MNPQPKQKPLRSDKVREWFRGQPCFKCGSVNTNGHHEPLNGHGMASKGPDDQQVPLCFVCHRLRHDIGRMPFWSRFLPRGNWRDVVKHYQAKCYEELNL